MIQTLTIQDFSGGISPADKEGPKGSFWYSRAMDFRKNANRISVLPHMDSLGVGVITGLIQEIVQVPNGTRYALDNNGTFYAIDGSNNVTVVGGTDGGAAGMVYRQDIDRIVMTGPRTASSYYPISGFPATATMQPNKYGPSASADVLAFRTGGGQAYAVPTAIDEVNGQCTFQPDIEPGYSVKALVLSTGSGDWTMTLHDDANNLLATTTILNASLTTNVLNEWLFGSQIRMLVKPNARTYHFHLTSTATGGTVACTDSANLNTADFEFWADRFVIPHNGLHPAIHFLQYVCIGNERYLTAWEPLEDNPTNDEWVRHQLTFPPGYEVCGLAIWKNYLAIACEQRSSTNTREFQKGMIFLWNGTDATYTDFFEVPEGSPGGLFCSQGVLYYIAAHTLWGYSGGVPVDLIQFPNTDPDFTNVDDFTFVNPNMITSRRKVLHVGYPTQTISETIEHGIYTYGRQNKNYNMSMGYSFVTSSGARFNDGTNQLRIGCVKSFGNELLMSWQNLENLGRSDTIGLDISDNSTFPSNSAEYQTLIIDNGEAWRNKEAHAIFATFLPLPANAQLTLEYSINRGPWQQPDNPTAFATSTGISCRIDKPFFEIQLGFTVSGAIQETVEVTTLNLQFENNRPLRLRGKLIGGTDQDAILV